MLLDPMGLCDSKFSKAIDYASAYGQGFLEGASDGLDIVNKNLTFGMIDYYNKRGNAAIEKHGSVGQVSNYSAKFGRDCLVVAYCQSSFGNFGTWLKNPIKYELNQTTLAYYTEEIAITPVLERNIPLGEVFSNALQLRFLGNLGSGPTPGGTLALFGLSAYDYIKDISASGSASSGTSGQ